MAGRKAAGRWADVILRSPGIGLPYLPVVVAVIAGAMRVRGWTLITVCLGCAAGLIGRAIRPSAAAARPNRSRRRPQPADAIEEVRGWLVVAVAVVAALWTGAVTLPRAIAAMPIGWPPLWVVLAVLACGAVGSVASGVVPARRRAVEPVTAPGPVVAATRPIVAAARRARQTTLALRPGILIGLCVLLVAAAAGMWVAGLTRSFL